MTRVKNTPRMAVQRRNEKRVTYTAILGFKDLKGLKGQKIPHKPHKPNATGVSLSLSGICFQSRKRPKLELVILYLPDGARVVAHVVSISHDVDSLKYSCYCEFVRWLPDSATTLEPLTQTVT